MTRVLRISVWVINGVLILLCAYWTAGLLLALTKTFLGGGPATLEAVAPVAATARPTWQERRVVLDKNLFQVSTLMPETPEPSVPPDADLDETSLPLTLLGTAASNVREMARASVRLDKEPKTPVLTIRAGQEVLDGVTVNRIDRRRVVLDNRGNLETLSLDDGPAPATRRTSSAAATPRARAAIRSQPRRNTATRARARPPAAAPVDAAVLRDPNQIIRQARFLPRYEGEALVGIGVDSVKSGSLLEDMGMRDGDTIVELNGINIEGSEDATELLNELQDLAEIEEIEVQVVGNDGSTRTLEYSYE